MNQNKTGMGSSNAFSTNRTGGSSIGGSTSAFSTTNKTGGTSSFGSSTNRLGGSTGMGSSQFGTNRLTSTQPTKYQAVFTKDALFDRTWNLRCAYNPTSKAYRFCYVFYDKRVNEDQPQTPENIDIADWVKIMQECPDPDHLVPTAVYGFEALQERVKAQKQLEKELSQRMDLIRAKLREMASFYATELCGSLERIKQNTTMIQQLMMDVVEIDEVQRNQGVKLNESEREMLDKLEQLRLELNRPGVFQSAIAGLHSKSKIAKENKKSQTKMAVDNDTLRALTSALKSNQDALEALEGTTKKVKRTVDTLDNTFSDLH